MNLEGTRSQSNARILIVRRISMKKEEKKTKAINIKANSWVIIDNEFILVDRKKGAKK